MRALVFSLEKGERQKMAFWASLLQLSALSREGIGAKKFDPGKCRKAIFAPLSAILLAGLLTKLSKV